MKTAKRIRIFFLLILSTSVFISSCKTSGKKEAQLLPSKANLISESISPTQTSIPELIDEPTVASSPTASLIPTSTSTKQPPLYSESVTIITDDGVELSGKLLGEGEVAVIMLHMVVDANNKIGSKNDWMPISLPAAREGYTVLSIDFRSFGDSMGKRNYSAMWQDVKAAIEFLKSRNYDKIVCMGASLGGAACLWAGANYDLSGLIIISSPMDMGLPNGIAEDELSSLTMKKLFIVSEFDNGEVADIMEYMAENAPDPKEFILYQDISAHGTELFGSEVKEEFKKAILDFLSEIQ